MAVADRLGLERFALYGHVLAGNAPAEFVRRHHDRLTSVVVWIGQTVAISPETVRQLAAIAPLMEHDWELFANINARLVQGWDYPEATAFAELVIGSSSPEARTKAMEAVGRAAIPPVEAVMPTDVPTLIAHLAGARATAAIARRIAAASPMAHVVAIPGSATGRDPFVYDNEVLIAAIADFVEATAAAPAGAGAAVRAPELQLGAMRAILFTDIVGHTEMMSRLGDAKGRDVLREHERITRETLAAHGGAEVKAMGDGFMAWFSSAQKAVECGVALQRAIGAQADARGGAKAPQVQQTVSIRVGINAGEPIEEDGDLFGSSVIAASRICSQAGGGEIVVSDVVRQLVAGKGFAFSDRGEVALRGFEDPARLWTVVRSG
jgi:class 3 adenylate cyclase